MAFRGQIAVWGLLAVLVPVGARAQGSVQAPSDLGSVLKPGQSVTVTDASGTRSNVRVLAINPSTLEVAAGRETRILPVEDIAMIRKGPRRGTGALLGALIGGGVALAGFKATEGRGSDSVYFYAYVGSWLFPAIGSAAGAAAACPGAVLYSAPGKTTRLTISPTVVPRGGGVRMALAF